MTSFKGKRGEAASMALLVVAMVLILNLSDPTLADWVSLGVLFGALGRIIWIFPSENTTN